MRDLSKYNRDYAIFTPAISSFYVRSFTKCKEEFDVDKRIPKTFEHGIDSFNFINKDKGCFFYDHVLYSAGHAILDPVNGPKKEALIHGRNKKGCTVISDSGGYQIGTGKMNFDWSDYDKKPGDKGYTGKTDQARQKILDWQEETSEWSMTLDIPPWNVLDPEAQKRTGLKTFQEYIDAYKHNLDFYKTNRQGKTKFLNVLHGRNWEESEQWYNQIKDYDFEGWAFAGCHPRNMYVALRRLITMRDEGKLENAEWLHVLGRSKLDFSCYMTLIQRQLRKHVNPDITVTFDCASPFIASANALTYTAPIHTADRFSYIMQRAPDNKLFSGSDLPLPFKSEIFDRMTMGDLCWYTEGDLDRRGKEPTTSWDMVSYMASMAHNTYQHIRAVQVANQYMDVEKAVIQPDLHDWKKLKTSDKSGELSKWVPRNILFFATFIESLFESEKPMSLLDQHQDFLADVSDMKSIKTSGQLFHTLFEHDIDEADDRGFASNEEDKLEDLENKFDN